jgi:hypothetical protein
MKKEFTIKNTKKKETVLYIILCIHEPSRKSKKP